MFVKSLVLAFPVAVIANGVFALPTQWTIDDGGNGHFYELVLTESTWFEARELTEFMFFNGQNGNLLTITSLEENSFVVDTFGSDLHRTFLGAIQDPSSSDPAANWTWVTDEDFDFTNWAPGEPNDDQGLKEGVLEFSGPGDSLGQWNDTRNDAVRLGFVVEYVPAPSASLVLILGGVSLARRRFRQS